MSRSTCWLLCCVLLKPFYLLLSPFSCVLAFFGRVQIQILWSRPTPIHLSLYQRIWIISFMHVYVCLLASILYIHVYLSRYRFCHALCPPWACAYQSLGPLAYVITSIPPRAYLDVTTCEIHLRGIGVLDSHLSLLRAMLICLPCLLCATRLDSFASLHLYTLAYMFMHESVCRPYSNPMKLWTFDPNLHLSFQDTLFCFIICLFASLCVSHFCLPLFGTIYSLSFSMFPFYLCLCSSVGQDTLFCLITCLFSLFGTF